MESSGSISSSHSEKLSNEQVSKPSSDDSQSPEVSSRVVDRHDHETERVLTEKLASALSNIRVKDNLVKQHAKVAEEAVSGLQERTLIAIYALCLCGAIGYEQFLEGWEHAENEVASLKLQLENSLQNNSCLKDKVNYLDGALKECLRQLRLLREEQEEKIRDAILQKMREWETEKFDFESHIIELESQQESAKSDLLASLNEDFMLQLEGMERENSELKVELHILLEKLRAIAVESELSTRAAETASKLHLESIKKVAKLEAECRRLRAATIKSCNEHKSLTHLCAESLMDNQSDTGDRMLAWDNEPCCSDSWASALIAELDQFRSEKSSAQNISSSPVEIDLMNDFLEMERLAALHVRSQTSPSVDVRYNAMQDTDVSTMKVEHDRMVQQIAELEEKLERMACEKAEMIVLLAETEEKLEVTSRNHREGGMKLLRLQMQLDSMHASENFSKIRIEAAEAKGEAVATQLGVANKEICLLCEKISNLESELDEERRLCEKLAIKCKKFEDDLETINRKIHFLKAINSNEDFKIKQESQLANAAGKLAECQQTIASLGLQMKSLSTMDNFMVDDENILGGSPVIYETKETISKYPLEGIIHPSHPSCRKDENPTSSSSSSQIIQFSGHLSRVSSSRHLNPVGRRERKTCLK